MRHLVRRRLRWWWLLVPGLGLRLLADHLSASALAQVVLLAGYACLLTFVAVNRVVAGMGVVGAGLLLNAAVVTVDGGMPVRTAAVHAAGGATAGVGGPAGLATTAAGGGRHHVQGAGDRLTLLDDGIAVRPLHDVLSVGDLVLAVGVVDVAAHLIAGVAPPAHRERRRRRSARRRRVASAAVRKAFREAREGLTGLVVAAGDDEIGPDSWLAPAGAGAEVPTPLGDDLRPMASR